MNSPPSAHSTKNMVTDPAPKATVLGVLNKPEPMMMPTIMAVASHTERGLRTSTGFAEEEPGLLIACRTPQRGPFARRCVTRRSPENADRRRTETRRQADSCRGGGDL